MDSYIRYSVLQDRDRIWSRGHSSGDVKRRAGEEERPLVLLLASLRQLLEIEHLPDRDAREGEKPMMQSVAFVVHARALFKRRVIPHDRRKVVVPYPPLGLLISQHANPLAPILPERKLAFLVARAVVPCREAEADEEHIAGLEHGVLEFGDGG